MTISQWLTIIGVTCFLAAAVVARRRLRLGLESRGDFGGPLLSAGVGIANAISAVSPRIRHIVVVSGLGIGLVLYLKPVLTREPLHNGKPVGYWVDRACEGYDNTEASEFRREVKNIGRSAVPLLVKKLRPGDGSRYLYRWLRNCVPSKWQQILPDVLSLSEVEEQRHGAVRTLALFGADAKPAVGTLARLLPKTKYPFTGMVIRIFKAMCPDAKAALPVLHSMLKNPDTTLRVDAVEAIWAIAWETNVVLQICTNALASPRDGWAKSEAGVLLSRLQTAAALAVPFARNLVQDSARSIETRVCAAQVLGSALVSTPEIRALLLAGTQAGQDDELRAGCAVALWRLDSQYAPLATRLLLEHFISRRKRFPALKTDFARWLESRGLPFQQGIPTLNQLRKSDSLEIGQEAARALYSIEGKNQKRGGAG